MLLIQANALDCSAESEKQIAVMDQLFVLFTDGLVRLLPCFGPMGLPIGLLHSR